MFSDSADTPRGIGASMVDTFEQMIARTVAFKKLHGPGSIYDLHYPALMRDPIVEMKKLYAHFDEPFTPQAQSAMSAFLANNPQGKHGRHSYSLEEFGLTRAEVRERFRDYSRQFGIASNA